MTALRAMALLSAVECEDGRDPAWSLAFVHTAIPASKARPRFVVPNGARGNARTYTPATTRAAEEHLAWMWRTHLQGKTHDGGLAIACVFYRPNRQRIDADNMTKLVLDAGTKARAWHDDSQIVTIVARIELDAANPRTEIALMPSTSTLGRDMFKTITCPQCKITKTIAASAHVARGRSRADYESPGGFCSNACAQAASLQAVACTFCEKPFTRRTSGQSLCSPECKSGSAQRTKSEAVAAGRRKGPPLCDKCGGRVSRREYKQCAKCLGRGRPKGSTNEPGETSEGAM